MGIIYMEEEARVLLFLFRNFVYVGDAFGIVVEEEVSAFFSYC